MSQSFREYFYKKLKEDYEKNGEESVMFKEKKNTETAGSLRRELNNKFIECIGEKDYNGYVNYIKNMIIKGKTYDVFFEYKFSDDDPFFKLFSDNKKKDIILSDKDGLELKRRLKEIEKKGDTDFVLPKLANQNACELIRANLEKALIKYEIAQFFKNVKKAKKADKTLKLIDAYCKARKCECSFSEDLSDDCPSTKEFKNCTQKISEKDIKRLEIFLENKNALKDSLYFFAPLKIDISTGCMLAICNTPTYRPEIREGKYKKAGTVKPFYIVGELAANMKELTEESFGDSLFEMSIFTEYSQAKKTFGAACKTALNLLPNDCKLIDIEENDWNEMEKILKNLKPYSSNIRKKKYGEPKASMDQQLEKANSKRI